MRFGVFSWLPAILCVAVVSPVALGQGGYLVVDQGKLAPLWKMTTKAGFVLPKSVFRHHAEGCVAIGFSVEVDGKPGNITILRNGFNNNADKGDIEAVRKRVMQMVGDWRFEASADNPDRRPAYTYTVTSFNAYEVPALKKDVEKRSVMVQSACEIADFPGAVARGELVDKPKQQ